MTNYRGKSPPIDKVRFFRYGTYKYFKKNRLWMNLLMWSVMNRPVINCTVYKKNVCICFYCFVLKDLKKDIYDYRKKNLFWIQVSRKQRVNMLFSQDNKKTKMHWIVPNFLWHYFSWFRIWVKISFFFLILF